MKFRTKCLKITANCVKNQRATTSVGNSRCIYYYHATRLWQYLYDFMNAPIFPMPPFKSLLILFLSELAVIVNNGTMSIFGDYCLLAISSKFSQLL